MKQKNKVLIARIGSTSLGTELLLVTLYLRLANNKRITQINSVIMETMRYVMIKRNAVEIEHGKK